MIVLLYLAHSSHYKSSMTENISGFGTVISNFFSAHDYSQAVRSLWCRQVADVKQNKLTVKLSW